MYKYRRAYNAVADKNAKIIADLERGKRRKLVRAAIKVQNVVNTMVEQDNVEGLPRRSTRNNVDGRSRNPITWGIAGGKGEEVMPGIRTKYYVGTYNGDNRNS